MKIFRWFKRVFGVLPRRAAVTFTPPVHAPSINRINRPASAAVSRNSIAELSAQIAKLQASQATWPEIWTTLNPDHDQQVQKLLVELRGPHMFAPHIALNALEEGCQRIARTHSRAGRLAVLEAALDSCNRIIRDD